MATAEFSRFAGVLSAALSQHHILGFEIAQLEFTGQCSLGSVAGQNLGFLCPLKPNKKNMETEFGGNRKVVLVLSQQRGEHRRLMPQKLCAALLSAPSSMKSLGDFI